jgi:hypothetical protein
MAGQQLIQFQGLHTVQRMKELAKRIALRQPSDVGGDSLENVVAAEQSAVPLGVEAEMTG